MTVSTSSLVQYNYSVLKLTLAELGRRVLSKGGPGCVYEEVSREGLVLLAENVLVDVCLHCMIEDYKI